MEITKVRIQNFRCIADVRIDFAGITAFIGPNGVGKSTVLRALDWFFNAPPNSLERADICAGAGEGASVVVEVEFGALNDRDREVFGPKYAPEGATTLTIRREWDGVADKTSGNARSYPPFDALRAMTATERKAAWKKTIEELPAGELRPWKNKDQADADMTAWESKHTSHLDESFLPTTNLHGFNGNATLRSAFEFVFVSADLRAHDETEHGRDTIIGRLVARVLKESAASTRLDELVAETETQHALIVSEAVAPELDRIAGRINAELGPFATGRSVRLEVEPVQLRFGSTSVVTHIMDSAVETPVDRQGHGFRRALIISALKLLAESAEARSESEPQRGGLMLAIEEPELFQHPSQSRRFAKVLRTLAQPSRGIQVAFATHAPAFIDPANFEQVRRVSRGSHAPGGVPEVLVRRATRSGVRTTVGGYVKDTSFIGGWEQVCSINLASAFFAQCVVLVEGPDDQAVLESMLERPGSGWPAEADVVVASVAGKGFFYAPQAILAELGIPWWRSATLILVCDPAWKSTAKKRTTSSPLSRRPLDTTVTSRHISVADCRHCRMAVGACAPGLFFWADDLESALKNDWPSWSVARDDLVSNGNGVMKKNAPTYRHAAARASDEPSGEFARLIEFLKVELLNAPQASQSSEKDATHTIFA